MWQRSMIDFLREKRGDLGFHLVFLLVFVFSGPIFSLGTNFMAYMVLLGLSLLVIYLYFSYRAWAKKGEDLDLWLNKEELLLGDLPNQWQTDPTFHKLVELRGEIRDKISQDRAKDQALKEYITIWAHQIKSPLFALRLLLKEADPDIGQANKELFEMEEYIQNILGYVRLESESTDYVFSKESLDDFIRASIRKYSLACIGRGNRMDFRPTNRDILTDSKWFSFMLDQVLSNAIKYTKDGTISIFMEEDRLCIQDTGIGIRGEDLPRIFDRGYTGYNGRLESKSTGLGLALVKAIGKNLGVEVGAKSQPGLGTCIWMKMRPC